MISKKEEHNSTKIKFQHGDVDWYRPNIYYEEILVIAGYDPTDVLSVICTYPEHKGRAPARGDTVVVRKGMRIEIAYTVNA